MRLLYADTPPLPSGFVRGTGATACQYGLDRAIPPRARKAPCAFYADVARHNRIAY
jgi:hypothetical protein